MLGFKQLDCTNCVSREYIVVQYVGDKTLFDVFEKVFPKLSKVFCWNHVLSAAKERLCNHGATSADMAMYFGRIRTLLHAQRLLNTTKHLKKKSKLWSQPFKEHYLTNIHPHIGTKLG